MKKAIILLQIVFLALCFTSCTKEDPNSDLQTGSIYKFKIDNILGKWKAVKVKSGDSFKEPAQVDLELLVTDVLDFKRTETSIIAEGHSTYRKYEISNTYTVTKQQDKLFLRPNDELFASINTIILRIRDLSKNQFTALVTVNNVFSGPSKTFIFQRQN